MKSKSSKIYFKKKLKTMFIFLYENARRVTNYYFCSHMITLFLVYRLLSILLILFTFDHSFFVHHLLSKISILFIFGHLFSKYHLLSKLSVCVQYIHLWLVVGYNLIGIYVAHMFMAFATLVHNIRSFFTSPLFEP